MGTTGPIPKRDSERRRRNKPDVPTDAVEVRGAVPIPKPDRSWQPLAREWYQALAESGQSQFYEPSDWAMARYTAELMSRMLAADTPNAKLVSTLNTLMSLLLCTEGDRRRVRMEIERDKTPQTPASVVKMNDYRDALGG
jgi:hypothetical protein